MTSLRIDLSVLDDPARGRSAASVAQACASLFFTHGAVVWTDELEIVPVVVATVLAGSDGQHHADDIQGYIPAGASLRVRDAARVVARVCEDCDVDVLRRIVAAAENGVHLDLADNAPGWAFELRADPELAVAAGIAYDAIASARGEDHQPITMAAANILEIASDHELDDEPAPAPAPGM